MPSEIEVDWQNLHSTFVVHQPNTRCFFSLIDGNVVRSSKNSEETRDYERDVEHFRPVGLVPSPIQYIWLNTFIECIEDRELQTKLRQAVDGKGAFRRFKDAIAEHVVERRQWFEYRDQCLRDWLWDWVAEQGVKSKSLPPWDSSSATKICDAENVGADTLNKFIIDSFAEGITAENLAGALLEKYQILLK